MHIPGFIAGSALAAALLLASATPAAAQNEAALRASLEGKRVTLKIDMPGTFDGVDVRPDAVRPIDFQRHGQRLKSYGTALREGETTTVTLVKLKKDLIEFQLNGGGFGTLGDDSSTSVSLRDVEKSSREKDLEKRIEEEKDSRRRERMEDELDGLRSRRERENRRIEAERARIAEIRKQRIAEERLKGGSRVMAALADYVDFSPSPFRPEPASSAAGDLLPRKGMMRADAECAFGRPVESSDGREGSLTVSRVVFVSGGRESPPSSSRTSSSATR